MNKRNPLILLRPDAALQQVTWHFVGAADNQKSGQVAFDDLAEWLESFLSAAGADRALTRTALVLPPNAGLHTTVSVTPQQRRYLVRTLPFLVEPLCTRAIEDQEVVAGRVLPGDRLEVLIVARRLLNQLVEPLGQLIPEQQVHVSLETQWLAAPTPDDTVYLMVEPERSLGFWQGSGFCALPQDTLSWLDRLVQTTTPPAGVYLRFDARVDAATADDLLADAEARWPGLVRSSWLPDTYADWLLASIQARATPPVSLLANRRGAQESGYWWSRCRQALAAGLILALGAGTFWLNTSTRHLEQTAQQSSTTLQTLYTEATQPYDEAPAFARETWRQSIQRLLATDSAQEDDRGFATMLQRVEPALVALPGSLQELRFNLDTGLLQFQAQADAPDRLEQMRTHMEDAGLSVSYSAARGASGFVGDFQVRLSAGDGSDAL